MSPVGLILGLAAILAAGYRTLAWAGVSLPRGAYRCGLAFAVGLVALTVLPFWLNLLGVPLASWLGIALGSLSLLLGGRDLLRLRRAGVQEAGTPLPAAARPDAALPTRRAGRVSPALTETGPGPRPGAVAPGV